MRSTGTAIAAALLALLVGLGAHAAWPPHSAVVQGKPTYTGPCDLVSCAEAWSMTRAMTASYSGPLFQIQRYSDNATLDIGQGANHVVNYAPWSAFCGGVQNNCAISKVYPQIHAGDANNTIIASVINGLNGPNCGSGTHGSLTCACPIRFDAAMGYPALMLALASVDLKYCIYNNNDNDLDGISGGSHDVSEFLVAYSYNQATNGCMIAGIAHPAVGPDTFGTDFGMLIMYGNSSQYAQCSTSNGYCLGADVESNAGPVSLSLSTSPIYMFGYESWTTQGGAQPRGVLTGIANGHTAWTPQLPVYQGGATANMNPGRKVHFAGGDDCPGAAELLEAAFVNAVADSSEPALRANATAFYSAVSFP